MGRPAINLVGQKFERLLVLHRDETKPKGAGKGVYWICQCDCGNICSVRSDKLRNNITKSCGCLSKEVRTQLFLDDLTGKKFGYLKVIERDTSKPMGKGHFAYWKCISDFGEEYSVRSDHLKDGTINGAGKGGSIGELAIRDILDKNNIKYKRQYSFKDLKVKDYLKFDFAIFKNNNLFCLIEYQGKQHYEPYRNFDDTERFKKRQEYDQIKRDYCKNNNIKLIEIPYTDFNKLSIEYLKEKMEY